MCNPGVVRAGSSIKDLQQQQKQQEEEEKQEYIRISATDTFIRSDFIIVLYCRGYVETRDEGLLQRCHCILK